MMLWIGIALAGILICLILSVAVSKWFAVLALVIFLLMTQGYRVFKFLKGDNS